MRGALSARGIGVAILLTITLSPLVPGTDALAVSQRRSDPFLIGPPGEVVAPPSKGDTNNDGDESTAKSTSAAHTTHSSKTPATSTSSSETSSVSSQSSTSSSSSHSTSTWTSSSSPSSTQSNSSLPPGANATKQPDSLKYLVPVFLFILITLGGWLFSRWYARRKVDEYEEEEYERGKWKQLKDAEPDEKDPWYSGDSDRDANEVHWQDVELVPAQSSGAISAAGRGWGWRSTMNAWKSARGKAEALSDEETDEMGQRRTIKLVPALPSAATYQTLPCLSGHAIDTIPEERGSIKALRDKIASLTYRERDQNPAGKLNRNRSPNKRRGGGAKVVAPPEAPAWIQPRATSPTQALSPPMQPHLFFHPTPSGVSLHGLLAHTAGSESGSDYGSDDESHVTVLRSGDPRPPHTRFPTIPSTATALANSYTALPPAPSPRKGGSGGSHESIVDGDEDESIDVDKTPTRRSPLKRAKTAITPSSRLDPTPMIRRSTALADLVNTPLGARMARSATTRDKATSSGLSPSPARTKRSKAQKKAEKAHDKVEDILKASWSDRALASPTSCMSLDGAVAGTIVAGSRGGAASPGVEEAAVFGGNGGGIEQRLAMLRKLET